MLSPFTVASYNVLADAYVRPGRYPRVPAAVFEPSRRRGALVARIAGLGADVVCLQEVEPPLHNALEARLGAMGYEGRFAKKGGNRPDGCSTFSRIGIAAAEIVRYHDGPRPSGHLALVVTLPSLVRVANTHVRWDAPGTPREQQIGLRQVAELLARLTPGAPSVIVGDFNCTCDGAAVAAVLAAGFSDAYATMPAVTFAADVAARIDFVLHDAALVARPLPVPPVPAGSVLPSGTEPSDHLPIAAVLSPA